MQTLTTKGISRSFRKALKAIGEKFPLTGPVRVDLDVFPMSPHNVNKREFYPHMEVVAAPIPEGYGASRDDDGRIVIRFLPVPIVPLSPPVVVPDLGYGDEWAEPDLPAVYKRVVREPKREGDKRRIDYRPVKNPKPGERYWVKTLDHGGKAKWQELPYGDNLRDIQAA